MFKEPFDLEQIISAPPRPAPPRGPWFPPLQHKEVGFRTPVGAAVGGRLGVGGQGGSQTVPVVSTGRHHTQTHAQPRPQTSSCAALGVGKPSPSFPRASLHESALKATAATL